MMAMLWFKAPPATPVVLPPAVGSGVAIATHVYNEHVAASKQPTEQGSVVLAVFHDADDRCTCVQLKDHEWGTGRSLAEVGRGELLRTAMAGGCQDNPDRLLVIAVSGPKDLLPQNTAEAEVLATCVAENGRCGDDSYCYASNAMSYLAPGVTVMAEAVGMGRR
jgi:hypothetical protein